MLRRIVSRKSVTKFDQIEESLTDDIQPSDHVFIRIDFDEQGRFN